jgi:hypothetical protein
MPTPVNPSAVRVPTWIIVLGSIAICFHFGVVGFNVLAARSGPWGDNGMADPPPFALLFNRLTGPTYLLPLRMTHNYHFLSNHPASPGVFLEAKLKDEDGKVITTVRLPDPEANAYVRHYQELLVRNLATDEPVQPPEGERVGPHGSLRTVKYWDRAADGTLKIKSVSELEVPRGRPVFRPSNWSLVLTRSFGRHLLHRHGAASVQLLRHTRDAVPPQVLFEREGGLPEELIADFGEFRLPELLEPQGPTED